MSVLDEYRTAKHAHRSAVAAYNALPTSQARLASDIDLESLLAEYECAALALVHDAGPRHTIEETAKFYLVLGPDATWHIDGGDDYGLSDEGYDEGPSTGGCEHEEGLDEECTALADAANTLPRPSAYALLTMLADQLGVTVDKV